VLTSWDAERDLLTFETERLSGILVADNGEAVSDHRHHVRNLVYRRNAMFASPEGSQMDRSGSLTLFRAYSKNSWLTELRALRPQVERTDTGAILTWQPTISHQVSTTAEFSIKSPNIIDVDITVRGYTHYPAYELLCSNYVHSDLSGGLFLGNWSAEDKVARESTMIPDSPAYHGMYNFFPRDETAAHIMTDGRGQKGRWPWHVACGRPYAYPLGFASNENLCAVFMGKPEDVSTVGVTYHAEGAAYDGVAAHHALYLSLFGRDLYAGDAWRTQIRLVVGDYGRDEEMDKGIISEYDAFIGWTGGLFGANEIRPD
jgi:hypothetical protein